MALYNKTESWVYVDTHRIVAGTWSCVFSGRTDRKCHLIRENLHTNNRLISSSANDASRNIWRQATSVPASLGSNAEGDPPEDLTHASECVCGTPNVVRILSSTHGALKNK